VLAESLWNRDAQFITLPPHFPIGFSGGLRRVATSCHRLLGKVAFKFDFLGQGSSMFWNCRSNPRIFDFTLVIAFVAGLSIFQQPARAAAPWDSLVPFRKTNVDPNSMYPVAESNGPYMIMTTTFQGDNAREQARHLVYELRSRYRLPAYTYEKAFDFTKPERGIGFNPDGTPKKMRYQQAQVIKEVAVLVGDYDTVDDPTAQRVLKKIKEMDPDCMKGDQAKKTQSLSAIRQLEKSLIPASATSDAAKKGPFARAFIATNPLLPREYFANRGVDKFVLELNKDAQYSLLDCRAKYTICVATFTGSSLIDAKKIEQVENREKKMPERLIRGEEKAHLLTEWLRNNPFAGQRWEAYEFHDRDKSIVCVGTFNSLGTTRPDGSLALDPRVQQILTAFGNDQALTASGAKTAGKAVDVAYTAGTPANERKHPELILFDLAPKPMEVPHRSISADYQHSLRSDL